MTDFRARRFARLALAALPLFAAGGCGKQYTCTIYGTIGGFKVLIKQVQVKSPKECDRLAAQQGA
jgi:hypothetical protein